MAANEIDNTATVEEFLTAFWAGDWTAAASFVTVDFSWENRPAEGVLLNFARMTEVADAFSHGENGYPVVETGHHHVVRSVQASAMVAQERVDVWRSGGKWFHLPCAGFWTLRDGLISSWTDYFDMTMIKSYKEGTLAGDDTPWVPSTT